MDRLKVLFFLGSLFMLGMTIDGALSLNQAQELGVFITAKDANNVTMNAQDLAYTFIFSESTSCSTLLTIPVNVTTDTYGHAFVRLNTSSLSTVPRYLCEYRNASLRAVHTLNTNYFEDFSTRINNLNTTANIKQLGFNTSAQYDVRYISSSIIITNGTNGVNGSDGNNGSNGLNGTNGINGSNASVTSGDTYINITNGVIRANITAFDLLYAGAYNTTYSTLTTMYSALNTVGNWSSDKASYTTLAAMYSALNTVGNFTNSNTLYAYATQNSTVARTGTCAAGQFVNGTNTSGVQCGTLTASGDGAYNTTYATGISNLENANITTHNIITANGNYSAEKRSYTTCTASQASNWNGTNMTCITPAGGSGDGTGGWTNTTTTTNTSLSVGIGVVSPIQKLVVNGEINATGNIYAHSGTELISTQTYFCDMIVPAAATMCYPNYISAALSSGVGTILRSTTERIGVFTVARTASANSGYYFETGREAFLLLNNEEYSIGIGTAALTANNNTIVYAGFIDQITAAAPGDGIYFQLFNRSWSGQVRKGGTLLNITATNLTNAACTTACYDFRILNNGTAANFLGYNSSGLIYNQSIYYGATVGSVWTAGTETGAGFVTYTATAGTISNITFVDYINTEIGMDRRPNLK